MSKCLLAAQQPESITPAEAEPSQTMHTATGIRFHHEQCNTPRFTIRLCYTLLGLKLLLQTLLMITISFNFTTCIPNLVQLRFNAIERLRMAGSLLLAELLLLVKEIQAVTSEILGS